MNPSEYPEIYLDFNATCPVHPSIRDSLAGWVSSSGGNPSSPHSAGKKARDLIESARISVAQLVHAPAGNVIFTSGATESILLVFYHFLSSGLSPVKVAIPRSEHPATLSAARFIESWGAEILSVQVNPDGQMDLDHLLHILRITPGLSFVSAAAANNETGVLQDPGSLASLTHQFGVPLHIDASQWIGKLAWPALTRDQSPDFISFSGHKFGALKGVGALMILGKGNKPFSSLMPGGGQQAGLRGGTENVLGIASMGAAARLVSSGAVSVDASYRDIFETKIRKLFPDAVIHSCNVPRLPNTSLVAIPGLEAELLVLNLSRQGIAVSTGSACSTGKPDPSHVLIAMNVPLNLIGSTFRVSTGHTTTTSQINALICSLSTLNMD